MTVSSLAKKIIGVKVFIEAEAPRVRCPEHGVVVQPPNTRLFTNFQNIEGMIGCSDQILPLTCRKVIFHPFSNRKWGPNLVSLRCQQNRSGKGLAAIYRQVNTIAHITALALAYAAVVHGSRHSYRSLKHLRRAG